MSKKKVSKKVRQQRRSRYGMVKIPTGAKLAWLSYENKHGWSLGLALGSRTIWLKNTRFSSRKEVERALEKSGLVFVNLKDSNGK